MQFDSRRASGTSHYLEFIWRTDNQEQQGQTLQAIAYITDIYGEPTKPWFTAYYGIHEISGPSVAGVKEELFRLIESGQ